MTTGTVSVGPRSTGRVEDQLLLNCARQEMSPELIEATRALLASEINWPQLIQSAWRHGVASLLHKHLSSQGLEAFVPNETRNELRQCYVRAAFRSQTHAAAIAELLHAFERHCLPVMLLKGAALGLTTYRDRALRPFADIDLLVREENIDDAKDALAACGYALAPELISEKLSRRFHVNLPFARTDDQPVHVELHWQLSDRFSTYDFSIEDFWQRAPHVAVDQTEALVLEVHDAIIYLAAHLDKHGYFNQALGREQNAARWILDEVSANRLIWFTDLHEIIVGNVIDWTSVEVRSSRGELRDVVASTLTLLRDLLGTEGIPATLLRYKRARLSKRFAKGIASFAAANESRRQFFLRHILRTRKGFELRLVRLFDLWNFVFSHHADSALKRVAQCASLFFALAWARLRSLMKRRS